MTGRFDLCALWRSVSSAWSGLLAPLIIVGGILSGVFTATEAGAVACVYAFIIGYFVYRKITLRRLPDILVDAAITTSMVSGIIAVSGRWAGCSPTCSSTAWCSSYVSTLSSSPTMILFILAGVMILLGTFVNSLIVLLVFAPVAVSVTKAYGLDPFQVGLVMVICNQIGAVSPPTAPLAVHHHEHRQDADRPDQPPCLDLHAGRDAGARARDPHPGSLFPGFRAISSNNGPPKVIIASYSSPLRWHFSHAK